jgi:hypothetical protein
MTRVEKNVGTVQKTLQEIGTRARVINRTLSSVDTIQAGALNSPGEALGFSYAKDEGEIVRSVGAGQDE